MKSYKLDPDGFSEQRRRLMLHTFLLPLAGGLIVLTAWGYFSGEPKYPWQMLLLGTPVIGVLFWSMFRWNLGKAKKYWDQYRIELDADNLTIREQEHETMFRRDQIEDISRTDRNFLLIQVSTQTQPVIISPHLERFDELREELEDAS